MIRLYSTIVYVFDVDSTKTLFLNHRKLGKWLPPGGKVDPNELPDGAAIREVLEETGLHVRLLGEKGPGSRALVRPYGMELNTIIPGEREHIDFVYLAIPTSKQELRLSEREASQVRWFSLEEIQDPQFNTFESTKKWVEQLTQEVVRYAALKKSILELTQY